MYMHKIGSDKAIFSVNIIATHMSGLLAGREDLAMTDMPCRMHDTQ